MLKLVNVEVKYSEVILVLRGISIEVPEGKLVCLLGANGAGKTTTLKAISGILDSEDGKVTDGFIEFSGQKISGLNAEHITKLGIFQILEGRRVLEHLSAEDNLRAGALVRKDRNVKADLEKIFDYLPRLAQLKKRIAGYLSGGEQQMLVIGRALMGKPRMLLLDEPSLGLSPLLVDEIFGILKRIHRENNISMLLVEQNASLALETAEYGYVLENGRVVLDGPSEEIKANQDIKEFYLGLSELNSRKSYREVKHYKRRKRWL
jgi:branched-chain amino acid transport system ATP-binding protein